ncbi:LANO_0G09450g1_1 [Lachancea nothofagi CBS 11611]|uniref:LANO_0G09450g1_1 n=1 Tax=Lachancea nothofagi CBS 11611 TaxID=1266666 RepID=A0A1G4KIS4_9SACH|nr:LANO_0G09450g1_1 [Lachancea nothofagi CBS 11611]
MSEETPEVGENPVLERRDSTWAEWIASPVNGLIGHKIDHGVGEGSFGGKPAAASSWFQNVRERMPSLPFLDEEVPVDLNNLADYSKLSSKQIQLLEVEAQQGIVKKADTWCWFEDFSETAKVDLNGTNSGQLSVANTGSAMCPLPLVKFPISRELRSRFYVENSLLLPNTLPHEQFHERTIVNKISIAFKQYYNFNSERHLYLGQSSLDSRLEGRKAIIISFVGGLPDKYEKATLGKQFSAKQLSTKLGSVLKDHPMSSVLTFSLESPLDQKPLEVCFEESIQLLNNWRSRFFGADTLLFTGVYHSVPLQIMVAKHMLEHRINYGLPISPTVGLLSIESCLGGYQFWDHSSDSNADANSINYQTIREKSLLQGSSKIQQDLLSQLTQYRDPSSSKSKQIQCALDWIFFHHASSKLVLIGRLYDSFMTIAEKLAVNYQHPNILRHVWCAGSSLGLDLKKSAHFLLTNKELNTEPLLYQERLKIPEERAFEICLVQNLVMAINLGYSELVPMLKMISPFFISRSFNRHTVPATLKKQQQYELKVWLQEMDLRWKSVSPSKNGMVPAEINGVNELLEYVFYKANKQSLDHFSIKGGIFEDCQIYHAFVCDTVQTTSLLEPRKIDLSTKSITPANILDNQNQYDLVWQLHDFLSHFAKLQNLPEVPKPTLLFFLADHPFASSFPEPEHVRFRRNNKEALQRIEIMWQSYHEWKPPTKGLKQLQRILSFLSLYPNGNLLQVDLNRIKC